MIIHGKDVILASATTGIAFGAAKSCDVDVKTDSIETSSATNGGWKTFITGRKEWLAHLSHIVTGIKSNVQMVGQTVSITFGVRDSATDVMTGTAIIEEWKITGTRGNLATGSFVLRGSGPLT